ncbi:hypothetical protein BP6252_12163 [Coleophoma cylindrospora]|uniref:Uncharacterized protein n=1 Tax=Coleophoma cylindrospora TaxID=1849047 RepID=A0A3D8QGH4_9HELO|nr:hypothetical protein BP6252_12163 [Coleophoma cylindrospora]
MGNPPPASPEAATDSFPSSHGHRNELLRLSPSSLLRSAAAVTYGDGTASLGVAQTTTIAQPRSANQQTIFTRTSSHIVGRATVIGVMASVGPCERAVTDKL